MARLVINPRSTTPWEIQLKEGANLIGRGFANDFKIDDPSVSGSHCEIIVGEGGAVIRDLGSTNGTYVNRAPVQEAVLQAGQTVHLGGVEMVFQSDAPGQTTVTAVIETEMLAPPPIGSPPPVAGPSVSGTPSPTTTGSQNCKFHPKTPGRYLCQTCQLAFCELCVTTRTASGGKAHKYCRKCGAEVVPMKVRVQRVAGPQGFFARLPGTLVYPFKGSGSLVLIIATLIFAGLDLMSWGGFAILMVAAALGYLFCYMQNILHCTAAGDDEMADLPGFDGLFGAFFALAGTVAISFGLPIALAVAKFFFDVEAIPTSFVIASMILGCLYFPMAFLAVAMKDTVAAANPLVVIPAILKVPAEYLVTTILLSAVFGTRFIGGTIAAAAKSEGLHTRDMSVLLLTFGLRAFWSFASVYLLTVGMRILGTLYVTKKQKLGWFSH